jgi:hypothetical protein
MTKRARTEVNPFCELEKEYVTRDDAMLIDRVFRAIVDDRPINATELWSETPIEVLKLMQKKASQTLSMRSNTRHKVNEIIECMPLLHDMNALEKKLAHSRAKYQAKLSAAIWENACEVSGECNVSVLKAILSAAIKNKQDALMN